MSYYNTPMANWITFNKPVVLDCHTSMSNATDLASGRDPESDQQRLRDLVYNSLSCEFASVRHEKPVTFPLTPFYDAERESVIVTSPPAFAGKVQNVKHSPRVSLLLHGPTGVYLLTGDARVRDDDFKANNAYLRRVIEAEPPTHKQEVFEATINRLDSWIGRALMGWYGLRIIVEITPVSLTKVADDSSIRDLPAWTAVEMDCSEAAQYERAVITTAKEDGYPRTWPVRAIRPREDGGLVESAMETTPPDGQPGCLLLHWHDDRLHRLGQRVVRGRFRTDSGAPRFVPGSCSTLRNDGLLDTLRFIIEGKRRTRAYFGKDRWLSWV